jgi:hypothetical protein
MDTVTARHIIEALADGLDPSTGEGLAPGSPLESPEVIRALHVALNALDLQIRKWERDTALPSNAGKSWSPKEDRALAEAFDAGDRLSAIASRFGRTEGSIASRLVRIGKVPDRDTARRARS